MSLRKPKGLGYQGSKLWADISDAYLLEANPEKLRILLDCAKLADQIDELEKGMSGQPLTAKGSANQIVIHPLIAELRASRALMANLLARLRFTDEETP